MFPSARFHLLIIGLISLSFEKRAFSRANGHQTRGFVGGQVLLCEKLQRFFGYWLHKTCSLDLPLMDPFWSSLKYSLHLLFYFRHQAEWQAWQPTAHVPQQFCSGVICWQHHGYITSLYLLHNNNLQSSLLWQAFPLWKRFWKIGWKHCTAQPHFPTLHWHAQSHSPHYTKGHDSACCHCTNMHDHALHHCTNMYFHTSQHCNKVHDPTRHRHHWTNADYCTRRPCTKTHY